MVAVPEIYWRPRPRPWWPKKRPKKKLTPAQKRKKVQRAHTNQRARTLPKTKEEWAAWREENFQLACDLDGKILPKVQIDEQTQCWVWIGRYRTLWDKRVCPIIGLRDVGVVRADHAAYTATTGKRVRKTTWLERTCGNVKCVNPDHGRVINHVIVRARKKVQHELEQETRDGDETIPADSNGPGAVAAHHAAANDGCARAAGDARRDAGAERARRAHAAPGTASADALQQRDGGTSNADQPAQ